MQNAAKILILALGVAALACCHKQQPQGQDNQDLAISDNLSGQIPQNADVETLPADESSGTSNSELSKGDDNPDVNDLGNGN